MAAQIVEAVKALTAEIQGLREDLAGRDEIVFGRLERLESVLELTPAEDQLEDDATSDVDGARTATVGDVLPEVPADSYPEGAEDLEDAGAQFDRALDAAGIPGELDLVTGEPADKPAGKGRARK